MTGNKPTVVNDTSGIAPDGTLAAATVTPVILVTVIAGMIVAVIVIYLLKIKTTR